MATGFGCMVVGPAGSGKSTMCHVLQQVAESQGRTLKICNLDPAAEVFKYRCDIDVRDLISLDDVQELENYGPNGGLVYCMEHLVENIEWLIDELNEFSEDSFILFDCPGQIELYSHLDVMQRLSSVITKNGFYMCAAYCSDGTYLNEPTKYIATSLTSISTMMQMGLPHINVLTKCDKIPNKEFLDHVSEAPSCRAIISDQLDERNFFSKKFFKLNQVIVDIVDNFSMVNFIQLNIEDEESVSELQMTIDNMVQYDENRMPSDKHFQDGRDEDADGENDMADTLQGMQAAQQMNM